MKNNLYFIFQAIINLPFGLLLLLSPAALYEMQFIGPFELDAYSDAISRAYGAVLTACGTANLFRAFAKTKHDGYYLVLIGLVGGLTYVFVDIHARLQGIMSPASLGTLVSVIILSVWSLMILLKKPKT
jgi:hypothetical protein